MLLGIPSLIASELRSDRAIIKQDARNLITFDVIKDLVLLEFDAYEKWIHF